MRLLRPLARIWTILLGCTASALMLAIAARFLLPLAPWNEPPALVAVSPTDGAVDVLPRSPIILTFAGPMNRQTTLDALTISPPTPGEFVWSIDATSLTFRPTPALTADVTYTLRLDTRALGQWWRPLPAPRTVSFRTAPLPAVVAALPNGPGTPRNSSIAVIFSQPMAPPERVGQPAELPQLRFEPPIQAELRWIDPSTLLIRPTTPLLAATRYNATIGPELSDLRGIALGNPVTWSFSTAWPAVIERAPRPGERWAGPRQPLILTLDAPIDPALIERALRITPPVTGTISAAPLGGGQVITFTPGLGWEHGESYAVSLAPLPDSGLADPPDLGWRFRVEPPPGLLAFFPGQGQILAPGQDVRLIFSTPMDEAALRAGLSIDPPVAELPLRVSGAEARLRPELRPSTLYTITIAAGTLDRAGEPLPGPAAVRVRSGPAAPSLRAPAAPANLITLPVSRTAAVELERVNLSALNLSLYSLDTPTLLLALGFEGEQWRDFSPERYGQVLARRWRLDLSDPLDEASSAPIPVGIADGDPLAPGAYYLRAIAPEGPRADLLLLVTPVELALRQSENATLVWASDSVTGTPAANLPVTLYAGDAELVSGVTGPDGVWVAPVAPTPQTPPLLAVAETPAPAVAGGRLAAPPATPALLRALVFLDQLEYRSGAIARIGGQARRLGPDGSLTPPNPIPNCRIQIVGSATTGECRVATDGSVSGSLRLDQQLAPGDYKLRVSIGESVSLLPLTVGQAEQPARLRLSPAGPNQLLLEATAEGLPLASAVVSWSLSLENLSPPVTPEGFRLSTPPAPPPPTTGGGVTDADGRLIIPLPQIGPAGGALSYKLAAELSAPGGLRANGSAEGQIGVDRPLVGLRLPIQLVTNSERPEVELLALNGNGQAVPGLAINLAVFRRGASGAAPLLERRLISDNAGQAMTRLVQLRPGEYEIVARAGEASVSAGLWVAGGSYAGWENPPGQVAIIPDRERYAPGDTARLLITAPLAEGNLLLSLERDGLLGHSVEPLRAGRLITLTITPEMAPGISLGAIVAGASERRTGAATLRVDDGAPPLTLNLSADQADYPPGATATLAISISDPTARLLLTLAPASAPTSANLAVPAPAPPAALLPLDAGAGGQGTLISRARLPDKPGSWRISAYALSASGRLTIASALVSTSRPVEAEPLVPAVLRPGDEATVGLLVRNTGEQTRTLRATLSAPGTSLDSATEQSLTLAPGAAQGLTWTVRLSNGVEQIPARFSLQGDGVSEQFLRPIRVLPAPPAPAYQGRAIAGVGSLSTTVTISPTDGLEIALAPGLRAALASEAEKLRNNPANDAQASLLLISVGLAEADSAGRAAWRRQAEEALAILEESQNADGGWGWWPNSPSDPFVSALVVEARGAARELLGETEVAENPRALAYLRRMMTGASPDLRAYIGYALSRADQSLPAEADLLASGEIGPAGLAFLALSLPAEQAAPLAQSLIDRADPDRDPDTLPWAGGETIDMPQGAADVNAAVIQALRAWRPSAQLLPQARRSLLATWSVEGWPSPYAAARIAAAILDQESSIPQSINRLLLDGEPVTRGPISQTVRLNPPAGLARPGAVLAVEAPATAGYLLAYRAPAPQPTAPTDIALAVYYVNQQDNARIDPAALRPGQLITVEVVALSARPLLGAELEIPLAAALEPFGATAHTPLSVLSVDPANRLVRIGAGRLPGGIYTIQIAARVIAQGRYNTPPPRLLAPSLTVRVNAPNELRSAEP